METPLRNWFALGAGVAALLAAPASMLAQARFSITDFGAIPDGRTINTDRIQAAIDYAATADGGVVVIPAGVFRSGSIFLKQGVNLEIEKDGVLLGSNNIEDYPKQNTRIEGHFEPWRMALINAEEITGLRIAGEGKIDGNGTLFWAAFWQRRKENPRCTNLEVERPRMMFIDRCQDVRISGLALRDSGFWNIHLYNCQSVILDDLDFRTPTSRVMRAPSTDGIDIDSCQHVTVRRCTIAVDDDSIALKGSKGPTADQDATSPPVEDILVEDCTFNAGHGVVTFGSEATTVRDVRIRNCVVNGDNGLVRLKLRPDTPQHYENLVFENIQLAGDVRFFDVQPWRQFFDLQGHEPPASVVDNVTIRSVTGSCRTLGVLVGNVGDSIRNIHMSNVDINVADDGFRLGEVDGFTLDDVKVNGKPFELPTEREEPKSPSG